MFNYYIKLYMHNIFQNIEHECDENLLEFSLSFQIMNRKIILIMDAEINYK